MWVEERDIKKRELEFAKKCEVGKLHRELIAAGFVLYDPKKPDKPFNFYGVSGSEGKTVVHLRDGETKDPAPVVKSHVYEEPKIPKPIDPEKLKKVLRARGIIKKNSEVEAET